MPRARDQMNRRQLLLRAGGIALGAILSPSLLTRAGGPTMRKGLFFSKSSNFEQAVIKRTNGEPSFVEKILAKLGPKHGIEFACSKDGSLFSTEYLANFDAY